jgi:hypothetical protein
MGALSEAEFARQIDALSHETGRLVRALRAVVLRTAPEVEETFVWGGLSYHRPQVGGRVKGAVCQIGFKGGHVRLEFIHGVRLADPCRLLRGNLRSKRFVSIEATADIERPELASLIREAAALDPTQWADVPLMPRDEPRR